MEDFYSIHPRKRRIIIKKEARRCLYNDWVMRILAFVIVGACYVGVIQFGTAFGLVVEGISQNTYLSQLLLFLYMIFAFVLVVPLTYGLVYAYVFEGNENGKINLCDLFYAFSCTGILMRSYRLFLYTLLRLLLCFLPVIALDVFCKAYYYSGIFGFESTLYDFDVIYFVIKSVGVIFALVGFVLSVKCIAGVYVSIIREDKEIGECFFVSRILCEGAKGELAVCAISFFPLIVLSLITFGFLFVMYTLPYMLVTFVIYCKYLYENEMKTLKTQNILYDDAEKDIKTQE